MTISSLIVRSCFMLGCCSGLVCNGVCSQDDSSFGLGTSLTISQAGDQINTVTTDQQIANLADSSDNRPGDIDPSLLSSQAGDQINTVTTDLQTANPADSFGEESKQSPEIHEQGSSLGKQPDEASITSEETTTLDKATTLDKVGTALVRDGLLVGTFAPLVWKLAKADYINRSIETRTIWFDVLVFIRQIKGFYPTVNTGVSAALGLTGLVLGGFAWKDSQHKSWKDWAKFCTGTVLGGSLSAFASFKFADQIKAVFSESVAYNSVVLTSAGALLGGLIQFVGKKEKNGVKEDIASDDKNESFNAEPPIESKNDDIADIKFELIDRENNTNEPHPEEEANPEDNIDDGLDDI